MPDSPALLPDFREFPKIARLNRECLITEKIDGTNACVVVTEEGGVFAQSRNRLLTAETGTDPFGFALWVERNKDALREALGPGYHYGEWWGPGIQRGYATSKEQSNAMGKRLSLFNVSRWKDAALPAGVSTVPLLYQGLFRTEAVEACLDWLRTEGSVAAPGFMKPEGIVVFHVAANIGFKVTLEKDEEHKGGRR